MCMAGRHVAEQLGLSYVFFCEFEELHSPLRSPALQVILSTMSATQHDPCYIRSALSLLHSSAATAACHKEHASHPR